MSPSSTSAVLDLGDRPLEGDVGEFADLELRQHFQRDGEGEVAARLERRLDRVLVGRQFDLRLLREPQAVFVDDLLVGLGDRLLHDIGHHRAAVDALEMRNRHFARPEAVDPHLGLHVGELASRREARSLAGSDDGVFALQPLAQRLGDLHFKRAS